MQREAMSSHSDGNSFNKSLISLGYSDLVDRQIQTHVMAGFPLPPSLGEDMISFNRDGEELWSLQAAGKDTLNNPIHAMEGISTTPSASFNSPRFARGCSTLEDTNYSYQGLWEFNRGVSNPELSSSGVMSYSLHKRQVGSDNTSCSSNFSSSKPSGTRFFQAMQEILAEFACYALDQNRASFASSCSVRGGSVDSLVLHGKEVLSKKKHLLSLLQVVDDQYNQCLDEIHTVISAFHAVTELDPNLHARFALPAISLMYRSLRERISTHILAMGGQGGVREDDSFESSFIQKQWALQQIKKRDHQLWRPQRGLPERSVSVLRAWMFQNFLHPYPKDAEKHLLALKSGLTRSQVSNWFINARVRLWKPMIEEMYAEMNRRKPRRNEEENNGSHRNPLSRRLTWMEEGFIYKPPTATALLSNTS